MADIEGRIRATSPELSAREVPVEPVDEVLAMAGSNGLADDEV
jgi:hypothetical protein